MSFRPHLAGARSVALFRPLVRKGEVDTAGIDADARAAGLRIAYPRVDPARGEIELHWVDEPPDDALVEGAFGVPEPRADAPLADPSLIERVIVPALAFDPTGHRIGFGGGFYDRLLPRCTAARTIGLCFDFQIIAEVPVTAGDRPVDLVITDRRAFSR
jgi:5-formyltetrahydrofolate cyclo-ligase